MKLTPRQLEVAALVAEGYTNCQIANRLVIAYNTVGVTLTRACDRLELPYDRDRRVLLARWWVEECGRREKVA